MSPYVAKIFFSNPSRGRFLAILVSDTKMSELTFTESLKVLRLDPYGFHLVVLLIGIR